jgi:hypothetical protein
VAEQAAGDGKSQFERDEPPERAWIATSVRNPAHHGVENEFRDLRDCQGEQSANQAEEGGGDHQGAGWCSRPSQAKAGHF